MELGARDEKEVSTNFTFRVPIILPDLVEQKDWPFIAFVVKLRLRFNPLKTSSKNITCFQQILKCRFSKGKLQIWLYIITYWVFSTILLYLILRFYILYEFNIFLVKFPSETGSNIPIVLFKLHAVIFQNGLLLCRMLIVKHFGAQPSSPTCIHITLNSVGNFLQHYVTWPKYHLIFVLAVGCKRKLNNLIPCNLELSPEKLYGFLPSLCNALWFLTAAYNNIWNGKLRKSCL